MTLYCDKNCLLTVEPKACDAAQRSWESTPIFNGEQPEDVEDSEHTGL